MHRKAEKASGPAVQPPSEQEGSRSLERKERRFGNAIFRQWTLPELSCEHFAGRISETDPGLIIQLGSPSLLILRLGEARVSNINSTEFQHITEHSLNLILSGPSTLFLEFPTQEIDIIRFNWTYDAFSHILKEMTPRWASLESAHERREAASLFPQSATYGLAVHTATHDLLRHLASDQPQAALHLRAKALEILAHLADEAHLRTQPQPVHVRSDYDRERLHFARTYLLERMAMPPSLPDLARIAGINEFKLKRGFKELFGQPVFAYLAAARLEKARELLLSTTMTATEVAFELGYASLQHFSHAFKLRYGVTPTALRKS